jgi:UV DNA damage endonuclease
MPVKIGYPCINYSVPCRGNRTFRLASYSETTIISTVRRNLACLRTILDYNVAHGILFFRITSDLVPFASHPVCVFDWKEYFLSEFRAIGEFIRMHEMRVSMHPDQFVIINALDQNIVQRSVHELGYHASVLDLMGLPDSAKIQIHIGGVYGNRSGSLERFIERYHSLPSPVQRRLVIENDDRNFTVKDCIYVSGQTGIPVLFDIFHHELNGAGNPIDEVLSSVERTWKSNDGIPMVDYSSQEPGGRRGNHAARLDPNHFKAFLDRSIPFDFDVMLEIKEKEQAAIKAREIGHNDERIRVKPTYNP